MCLDVPAVAAQHLSLSPGTCRCTQPTISVTYRAGACVCCTLCWPRLTHAHVCVLCPVRAAVALLCHRSLPQFSDGSFDAILDKGTLDSLMCGEHAGDSSMQMLEECHRYVHVCAHVCAWYTSTAQHGTASHGSASARPRSMCGSETGRSKNPYVAQRP